MGLRTKDFKIGVWHGKGKASKSRKEEQLEKSLFKKGLLYLYVSRHKENNTLIRLVAFEMPLNDPNTGECIDLLGIDKNWQPYIFELKAREGEGLKKAREEINKYHDKFDRIMGYVQKEIREKYLIPNFKFKEKVKKIVLAEQSYYRKYKKPEDNDINYFFLKDVKNISRDKGPEIINIHKTKKKNFRK